MKKKKFLALVLAVVLTISMVACGNEVVENNGETNEVAGTETDSEAVEAVEEVTGSYFENIVLGETGTDIETTISWFNHRTDLDENGKLAEYIAKFNELYPNIIVEVETTTDYAQDSLVRLTSGDFNDVIMIPSIDKSEYPNNFVSLGSKDSMGEKYNFIDTATFDENVYGLPYMAGANGGVVYNSRIFTEAGITETPATPEAFIDALKLIKENTDATPLYTNYAAGWCFNQWEPNIGVATTGDVDYYNNGLNHDSDPFSTVAKPIYQVLYDAVANDLIEDDYTTTDWESCKAKINQGEIACLVLGTWAIPQMKEAGDKPDDIGYMAFPVSVDGVQYILAAADYNYAVNANVSEDNQKAGQIFVKFMVEESGFNNDIYGLPIVKGGEVPAIYSALDGVTMLENLPSPVGEETFHDDLNSESELAIQSAADPRMCALVDEAANGGKTLDDIMAEWDAKWSGAQETLGIDAE